MAIEPCPFCGLRTTARAHTCPGPRQFDNVHHIERPEDYLSAGLLRFLADEKAEEAGPHCATCRCGEGL